LKKKICIAGSGKMAINIGLFFLKKEYPVHWLSHSPDQLARLDKTVTKTKKRIKRFFPEQFHSFNASTSLYSSDIQPADIIIESSRESRKNKQQIFGSLAHIITKQTLLLTNSSSILPHEIHPHCLGAHFFFPLELTQIVELISCNGKKSDHYQQSLKFLSELGLDVIEQDQETAFLINRLLLPLQALSFKALKDGFPPEDIEYVSKSELISFGQLSLMDSIGLDIVMTAAMNYQALSEQILDPDFNILISSLDRLIKMGKIGAKNNNGLLMGNPLPWLEKENNKKQLHSLRKQFKQLLEDGCNEVICQKKIPAQQLDICLDRIFHASHLPQNQSRPTT